MPDRETADLFLGHPGFATDERPRWREGVDRYVVYVVYLDGVPRELSKHDMLVTALEERDREQVAHERDGYNRTNHHLGVYDAENGDRGDLDWDDDAEADG